ncbi:MAG: hypothetical protein Q4G40_05865 [Brachybacterium sp.]|nr:hypothetical protein [Brachybacterium sp.]
MTSPTWFPTRGMLLAENEQEIEHTVVTVSPGLAGFVAMFLIALAVVLLVLDMTRRIRRVNARARVEERLRAEDEAAERAWADGQGDPGPTPGAADRASEDSGAMDGRIEGADPIDGRDHAPREDVPGEGQPRDTSGPHHQH